MILEINVEFHLLPLSLWLVCGALLNLGPINNANSYDISLVLFYGFSLVIMGVLKGQFGLFSLNPLFSMHYDLPG